jgi:uncharacterized membrane protein YhaH (DUF805 family)
MSAFAKFFTNFKGYPYRERFGMVSLWAVSVLVFRYNADRFTAIDAMIFGALLLATLFGVKGRPFWFFVGISLGAFLASFPGLVSK